MPRFGVAFNRRRSTATSEDFQHGQVAPEQPTSTSSFRVIERNDPAINKSFDGGARMAKATGGPIHRPGQLDLEGDENMFADLKSGNRHSNASTAPSSTDLDDSKHGSKKNLHDIGARAAPKSSGSGFLNRAGRTFSFGMNKKNSQPTNDFTDAPPVPSIQHQDFTGRARGMTDSTTSTATPPKLEENGNMDMGGDFGSMFTSFDKRASMATVKNLEGASAAAPRSLTGHRSAQPAPLSINKAAKVEPSPASWNSQNSDDNLLGSGPASPDTDVPPPVPRHQTSFKTKTRPSDIIEDEDAKLLQDSIAVGRLLSDNKPNSYSNSQSGRYRRDEDTFDTSDSYNSSFSRRPLNSSFKKGDDNMFEGTLAHSTRVANRYTSRAPSPPRNKVMTPAQFEKYRQDKERTTDTAQETTNDDDDEDEINYDDDEDEVEKSKQQAKQRRKQEAHMAVYRQQMMKVTGEQPGMESDRAQLPSSMSAPHLHMMKKTPSPGPPTGISDEDEDEEVPLAILQAHGFPGKNRPPTRLSNMGSNPNLRASVHLQPPRPGSAMGEPPANTQRHSALPAFARNLPQDPFVGASINKPAIRESMAFGGGNPMPQPPPQPQQQALPVGGLVGVIANEERSRAMRRGSPNIDGQKLIPGMNGPQGFDPMTGIPPHMMYQQMSQMMPPQPPPMSVGDQAQLQMTQQMSQFMQMQMQFMQMMAANNQQGGQPPNMGMPQMNSPYGGLAATQSMNDLSSRHSMMFEPTMEPPRIMDPSMRTMSMVQPPSLGSFGPQGGYAGSIRGGVGGGGGGMGYTPSIAPSERSNVGLPGRYRPVSQINPMGDNHRRTNTMSGALGRWDDEKPKATINIIKPGDDGSDDDDEEGWEAMKAKREKKRSMWKSKKGLGSGLSGMI